MNNKVTYRQQFTRCGKQRCRKCREGTGHGPYWYAYWSEKGRTISKYIGTHLPAEIADPIGVPVLTSASMITPNTIAPGTLTSLDKQPTAQPLPSPLLRVY